MELTTYLTVFALSSLSINFQRGDVISEEYFTLTDNFTKVNLYRYNDTINLKFVDFDGLSLYQINCTDGVIEFQWPYLINKQIMTLLQGKQIDTQIVSESTNHQAEFEEHPVNLIYQCIAGAALILVLIIESPILFRRVVTSLNHHHTPMIEQV